MTSAYANPRVQIRLLQGEEGEGERLCKEWEGSLRCLLCKKVNQLRDKQWCCPSKNSTCTLHLT